MYQTSAPANFRIVRDPGTTKETPQFCSATGRHAVAPVCSNTPGMRIPSIWVLLAAVATASVAAPGRSQHLANAELAIHVDGFDRTYLVHLPRDTISRSKRPVVMMLHGRGGSSRSAAHDFGWIEKADKEGFIVVFPPALPIDPARPSGEPLPANFIRGWNVPVNDTLWWTHGIATNYPHVANPAYLRVVHPPDTPFLIAVLKDVLHRYRGNARYVYIAGFSSGGAMAADLAQSASEDITAAAIVGSVGLERPRRLSHLLSVFLAIGTDDSSGQPSLATWNEMPAIAKEKWYGQISLPTLEQDAAVWAHLDGCSNRNSVATLWGEQIDWSGCREDVRVRALSIDHLGHEWPGSKPSRWNQLHAGQRARCLTDVLWTFFRSVH